LKAFKNFTENTQNDQSLTAGKRLEQNCFSCHAPQAKNASDRLLEEISGLIITAVDHEDSPEGKSARQELSKVSIDCYVCHMLNGMPEGEVEPNMIYGPGWDVDEPYHKKDHGFGTVKSEYLMSSGMCTRCHHDWPAGTSSFIMTLHKNNQEHLVTAKSSNKTCQSCHMMEGEMIIHNMPVYSGEIGFNVQQTADMIGLGVGSATFFSITMNVIARFGSRRPKLKMEIIDDQPAGGDEDEK